MKTVYQFLFTLVLLLPTSARAQEPGPTLARPEFSNCFPMRSQRPAGDDLPAARPQSGLSNYGGAVTPQGVLKVLVVFAGFTNDVDPAAPNYAINLTNPNNPWPQTDATHPVPGTSFPRNVTADFYTSLASFQNNAVDRTLSNFYYQMSRHSANPFKMQAVFFPKRINITATDAKNARAGGFFTYTDEVMDALKNDPDTQNFDFSGVDQRGPSPNFQNDNSTTPPDKTIDYTVIIWRNPGTPHNTVIPQQGIAYTSAGWAAVPGITGIPSANGQQYGLGAGFTQAWGMSGLDKEVFLHEFAHTLYNSPHYLAANRTVYDKFYLTEGPGMMGALRTHFLANAWERWYNGWVELVTGATRVNSDVQGAASLTATNGEFTLRDYVTTGDVMRIKLPYSDQYLWLENHQFAGGLDGRAGYPVGSQTPTPNPLRPAPRGIIAMVEGVSGSRSDLLNMWDIGCNGLKVVSAQGNFDYTASATSNTFNNYFLNYWLHDFTNPVANPFGGESQITRRRIDSDRSLDNVIFNDRSTGNSGTVSESAPSFILNGVGEDGIFGPDAAFNTVGQKMGVSHNPTIFEQQLYDQNNAQLAPIKLGGLSVELIARDANTGAITVKVRYNDTDVTRNTRWTGELQVSDVPGAANGADVRVTIDKTLTINKSGTNNRHTKLAGEFTNPTSLTCNTGSLFLVEGGTVNLEGAKTTFQVNSGAELRLARKSKMMPSGTVFVVKAGTLLDIKNGGVLNSVYASTLRVEAGGTLVIRSGARVQGGSGAIQVQNGGYLCVESGANLASGSFTLDVAPNAIIGTNPLLGLSALNCSSQLQFCGRLSGGNTALSVICPTGNEALQFDGYDDRVVIPLGPSGSPSPIHNLTQSFTIEASVRCDQVSPGYYSQPIFSNRTKDQLNYSYGMLFTVYGGTHLLFQLNGYNYLDENDPTMTVSSGCHHVAVSRDASDRLRFYIDGVLATYSPIAPGNPHTGGVAYLGGDLGFSSTETFEGQIGEVRIWNSTRTNAEVNQYKSAVLVVPQAGLVGYYDMKDPSTQEVVDLSAVQLSGNHRPNGYLGTTDNADSNDPTWVAAASLTCTFAGNFRTVPQGKSLADTVGTGRRHVRAATLSVAQHHLSQLTISPNPASGEAVMHFQLRDAGKLEVSIQDMTGFTRAKALPATTLAAGAHNVKLPLRTLLPGLYLVVVNSADGRSTIRLEVR